MGVASLQVLCRVALARQHAGACPSSRRRRRGAAPSCAADGAEKRWMLLKFSHLRAMRSLWCGSRAMEELREDLYTPVHLDHRVQRPVGSLKVRRFFEMGF